MKFLDTFFAAMHIANTVDQARLATDPDYRDAVIRELCGEQDAPQPRDNGAERGNGPDDSFRQAA